MKQRANSFALTCVLSIAMVAAGAGAIYGYLEVWNIGQVPFAKSDLWLRDAIYQKALLGYFTALAGGVTLGFAVPVYFRMCRHKDQNPAEPSSRANSHQPSR